MTLELIRQLARRRGNEHVDAPAVHLERDEDVTGLVAWFGQDRTRSAASIVIEGAVVGWLSRSDVLALLGRHRLGPGDGEPALLPGRSTQYQVLTLTCPTPGCRQSPVYALHYNAERPPSCALHHQPLDLS